MQHSDGSCLWGVWRMDESLSGLRAALSGTTLYEEAVQRFSALRRQQEWLCARLLLRHLLGEWKTVGYQPSGKPFLEDDSRYIGISHTGGYVAVIIGQHPVGIDIEQYGQRVHRVASRFMREDETAVAYQGDDTWGLLLHWSAKEELFKCMDASEVDFRQHLRVFPFVPQEQGVLQAEEYRTGEHRSYRICYLLHPDFVLTWYGG